MGAGSAILVVIITIICKLAACLEYSVYSERRTLADPWPLSSSSAGGVRRCGLWSGPSRQRLLDAPWVYGRRMLISYRPPADSEAGFFRAISTHSTSSTSTSTAASKRGRAALLPRGRRASTATECRRAEAATGPSRSPLRGADLGGAATVITAPAVALAAALAMMSSGTAKAGLRRTTEMNFAC